MGGYSVAVMCGLLIVVASLIAEHGLQSSQALIVASSAFSSWGAHTVPLGPWHVESAHTRNRTCVPCIGRCILNHWTTREVWESAFLRGSQVMPMLLVQEPHFENHCSNWCYWTQRGKGDLPSNQTTSCHPGNALPKQTHKMMFKIKGFIHASQPVESCKDEVPFWADKYSPHCIGNEEGKGISLFYHLHLHLAA